VIVEEVVKSIGTNDVVATAFDDEGERSEEESLLLLLLFSDWAAGSEYCRLMTV